MNIHTILILMIGLCYLGQVYLSGGEWIRFSPEQLLRWGGCVSIDYINDQYYRFFTASFLHGGIFHVLANVYSLYLGGEYLERFIGWRWFLCLYMFTAFTGAFLSSLFLSHHVVAIGASTADCGLFGSMFLLALKFGHYNTMRSNFINIALWILVPTLVPQLGIDYFGHLGGALGGIFMGGVIFFLWDSPYTKPRYGTIAMVLALTALAYAAYGFYTELI